MNRREVVAALGIAVAGSMVVRALGQTTAASEIAPGGKLRVGMIAITVLADVAEPVARFIGQKLGAAVEPVMLRTPTPIAKLRQRSSSRLAEHISAEITMHRYKPLSADRNRDAKSRHCRFVSVSLVSLAISSQVAAYFRKLSVMSITTVPGRIVLDT